MPDITDSEVRSLWDSMDVAVRDRYHLIYDDPRDFKSNLRHIVTALVANLVVTAEFLEDEESRYDWMRYVSTGESVIDRTKKAVDREHYDSEAVRQIKAAIAGLNREERLNVREWMREVFHQL